MTSEEQEVYAWMGVSPLLLSDRQPENPESAIVSVLLPGQTAPPVPAPQPVTDSIELAEKDSPAPAAAEPVPTESLPLNISNGHGAEDPPSGLPEIVSVTPGGDANGRPRRRRRRSSTRA
jgi:ribonuclease E